MGVVMSPYCETSPYNVHAAGHIQQYHLHQISVFFMKKQVQNTNETCVSNKRKRKRKVMALTGRGIKNPEKRFQML